jgi:hypothetical protein
MDKLVSDPALNADSALADSGQAYCKRKNLCYPVLQSEPF